MTGLLVDFLPEDRTLFRPSESIGDALMRAARWAWPQNTAKTISRRWNIEPSTAEKVCTTGAASAGTLFKAVKREGWALWLALGELILGHSLDDHLEDIANEHARLMQQAADRRGRVRRMLAPPDRRDCVGVGLASDDGLRRDAERRSWDDGLGNEEDEELGPPNLDLFDGPLQ